MKYDWLVVGAGLFGSVFAYEASKRGKRVLVIDKRDHIGGNCYTAVQDDIHVHMYGAHIFHTADKRIWDYMGQFCEFNHYINSPIANYNGQLYNLPFNMNTFHRMWGCVTPEDARSIIDAQRGEIIAEPKNLEEQAISLVGRDIYEKLIKGYTEKQWGRPCSELPPEIIKRLPVRFTYNNNYFRDPYQGIPKGGYTQVFERLLAQCDVRLGIDWCNACEELGDLSKMVLFTGPIDEYYRYCFGPLEYRAVRFEHEKLAVGNYQGVAVMNYTDASTPYTRIIEHKHFEFGEQPTTIISREYPMEWHIGEDAYYPVGSEKNRRTYERYLQLAQREPRVIFGGRLGLYRYMDMWEIISEALKLVGRNM